MPIVQVHLLQGRTAEEKKALLDAVTRAIQDSIGARLESIRVFIQEIPPTDYMAAGELASDRRKR